MRVEIEEPQRWTVTLGQTLLRVVTGFILLAHGVQRLADSAAWQDQLAELGLPEPQIAAPLLIAGALFGGLGLLFGLLTRTAAFVSLCVALVAIIAVYLAHARTIAIGFELPLLLLAASVFFLATGGGPLSADTALFRRARRKAIEQDETWQRPPYLPVTEGVLYDDADRRYRDRDERNPAFPRD